MFCMVHRVLRSLATILSILEIHVGVYALLSSIRQFYHFCYSCWNVNIFLWPQWFHRPIIVSIFTSSIEISICSYPNYLEWLLQNIAMSGRAMCKTFGALWWLGTELHEREIAIDWIVSEIGPGSLFCGTTIDASLCKQPYWHTPTYLH